MASKGFIVVSQHQAEKCGRTRRGRTRRCIQSCRTRAPFHRCAGTTHQIGLHLLGGRGEESRDPVRSIGDSPHPIMSKRPSKSSIRSPVPPRLKFRRGITSATNLRIAGSRANEHLPTSATHSRCRRVQPGHPDGAVPSKQRLEVATLPNRSALQKRPKLSQAVASGKFCYH